MEVGTGKTAAKIFSRRAADSQLLPAAENTKMPPRGLGGKKRVRSVAEGLDHEMIAAPLQPEPASGRNYSFAK